MEHKTKIILKILLIIFSMLILLGGATTCIVFWPIIASPICLFFIVVFLIYKNRSTELMLIPERQYYKLNNNNNDNDIENNLNKQNNQFKVMSYNVMANNVTFKLIYQNASFPILNFFKYRGPRIIQEIKGSLPSIICMQEVDEYNKFYKPKLEALGYDTYLNKRAKLFRHGALIGFQKDQWLIENIQNIDLDHASEDSKYKKHAAAIMAIAKFLKNGQKVLVCSIHTYFQGNAQKYQEIAYTTHRINQFLKETNNEGIPIILAGDFNVYRNSPQIKYLFGSQPNLDSIDESEIKEFQDIYTKYPYQIEHWDIKNAYDSYPKDLPTPYTHHMPTHQAILDFIFYSSNNQKLKELMQPPEKKYLLESGGTPNKYQSSDHIRIEAKFEFL